jgi:5-methylcytosine-specific restriction endonuclease McrA
MGRLSGRGLQSRLGKPVSRLRVSAPDERARDADRRSRQAWRQWYGSAEWRQLSWSVRLAAAFTCAICGRVEGRSGQTVCDHVTPHRGDRARFFDPGNLQCLCKGCHDTVKQRLDREG